MVIVHLHTVLRLQTEQGLVGRLEIPWSPGMDIDQVIRSLGLEIDEEHVLLVAGGMNRERSYVLQDGDELHLIPAISGG